MKTLRGRSSGSPKTYATIPAIRGFGDDGRPGQYLGQAFRARFAVRHPSGRTSRDGARVFDDVTKAAQSAASPAVSHVSKMERLFLAALWCDRPA